MRAAVLDAALAALLEHGYDGMNVADIARTAGVAETTVYRRWATKADLAAAAIGELAVVENPLPDTGSLRGDLRALLAQIMALLRRPEVERLARAAVALAGDDPRRSEARTAFYRARTAGSATVAVRAIERGELPAGADAEAVIEYLVAPAYLRLLLTGGPLDEVLLDDSVDRTIAAFAR
ncbi:MAG TPA: TetR/AcrR family transcriptional regulator C-terminal ligand-binding domain-containing protein [Baekduia sp.]|uniref:TetR/AcrR family transcriptional regulator n=1 Tax=Baekduia sp. TaxID=2600305 RepID=UPI002D77B832|nr:TetR/AcrR family transcriptional regulator C-terminal ligand-binding domain-containing protein [Baekduia sp.]HET6509051.1 TetR/AcrR family transcriptional regulator C-terminal ligand-binding domain-containing protein [Baekduia sp.]